MKLLYVIHQYFPYARSGTEQYCLATSREARRRGDDVTVLSLHWEEHVSEPPVRVWEETYDGFRVLWLAHWIGLNPNRVLRDYHNPPVAARFGELLDELRPDAVHFFHLRQLGADLIPMARARGLRTVVHLMDFWYLCPRFTLLRSDGALCDGPPQQGLGCVPCHLGPDAPERELADQRDALAALPPDPQDTPAARLGALVRRKDVMLQQLAQADHVFAPSRFLAGMFVHNGFPAARIEVLPYGLDPDRVHKLPVLRPRTPLRVGFIGVLSPWKAPHVLIDAVLALPELPLELTLHGDLTMSMFADYVAGLQQRAAGDPRIRFAGAFAGERLDEVLAGLDLLVVPSIWYENTPFVVLEAFAAGVPVAASELGGLTELVQPGRQGWLFPAGDAQALAELLRTCVAEPQRFDRLAVQVPASIAMNYDRFRAVYGGQAPA